jgi:hypothetical protein
VISKANETTYVCTNGETVCRGFKASGGKYEEKNRFMVIPPPTGKTVKKVVQTKKNRYMITTDGQLYFHGIKSYYQIRNENHYGPEWDLVKLDDVEDKIKDVFPGNNCFTVMTEKDELWTMGY